MARPDPAPFAPPRGTSPTAAPFAWSEWAVRIAVAILVVTFFGAAWWEMKARSENIRQYAARQIAIQQDVEWIRARMERGERTGP